MLNYKKYASPAYDAGSLASCAGLNCSKRSSPVFLKGFKGRLTAREVKEREMNRPVKAGVGSDESVRECLIYIT